MVLFACADGACAQILGGELEVERHLRPLADVALGFDTTAVGLIRSPAKAFPDHHAAWGHQW